MSVWPAGPEEMGSALLNGKRASKGANAFGGVLGVRNRTASTPRYGRRQGRSPRALFGPAEKRGEKGLPAGEQVVEFSCLTGAVPNYCPLKETYHG